MIIVIDAYNLLHAMPSYKKTLTDGDRMRFLKDLGLYGKRKGHKMVVVFDGGPFDWPNKEKTQGVYVVYSGMNETADDYIKEYIAKYRSYDLLLVSSDGDLVKSAHNLSIPSIDSRAFFYLLQEALQNSKKAKPMGSESIKLTHEQNEELDELMESTMIIPEKSEDIFFDDKHNRASKSKQVDKKERSLLKKLHKL